MDLTLSPSDHASEKKQVAQKLMRLFRDLGIGPGEQLPPEQELATRLGVSRPVIREALSVLEALGLCIVRKGSGRMLTRFYFGDGVQALVELAMPSETWLRGLLDLRQALEGAMLPRAFQLINDQTLQVLEKLTVSMESKAAAGEYFGEEDRQFHLALYQALNNDALNGILQLFWAMYDKLDVNSMAHSQRLDETAAHHRKILNALKAGDIRRAQHQLDSHFYDTGYALERYVRTKATTETDAQ